MGANTKKIPAQLSQKKYKSCITAQSKKKTILQISPEKIFMEKKNFHFIFNYQLTSKILSSFQVNKSQSKVQSRVQSRVQSSFSIWPLKRAGARLKDTFGKYDGGHDTE